MSTILNKLLDKNKATPVAAEPKAPSAAQAATQKPAPSPNTPSSMDVVGHLTHDLQTLSTAAGAGVVPAATANPVTTTTATANAAAIAAIATTATTSATAKKPKHDLKDFTILRTLGTGSFGRVHLVQKKAGNQFLALKVMKKSEVVRLKQVEHTMNEKKILDEVQHPFLVNMIGCFQDSANLYFVLEYVSGGELFSFLRRSQVGSMCSGRSRFGSCFLFCFVFRHLTTSPADRLGTPLIHGSPFSPIPRTLPSAEIRERRCQVLCC